MKGGVLAAIAALVCVALAGCGEGSTRSPRVVVGEAEEARKIIDPGGRGSRIVRGKPLPRALPLPVPFGSRGKGCSGTALQPTADNLPAVARATICLLNVERRARRLRPLRPDTSLARAALGHSKDMVRRAYFSHDSLSGTTFVTRIRRSGYFRRAGAWLAGENLAWGTDILATPAKIVAAWMASPGHRANVLERKFRDVGIGIVLGTPQRGLDGGATYTSAYGFRS